VPVVELNPATATDAEVAAVHGVLVAANALDRPRDPAPPPAETASRVRSCRTDRRMRFFLATEGSEPVGYGDLWLSDVDNPHMGLGSVRVHPRHRGRGVGTALVRTVAAAMAAEGRPVLLSATVAGTAGDGFVPALGGRRTGTERISLLELAEVDRADIGALAAAEHPGYRLEAYTGALPDERVAAYAVAETAMNDAPHDDADLDAFVFTPGSVRADEAAAAERGELHRVLALDATDRIAGFTEVVAKPGWSSQRDTAVVPAHRGHGLGLWLKAAMLVRLRTARPDVTALLTGNQESNRQMLAINDRLGFRTWAQVQEYQSDVADLIRRLG
jgi:GNAT superfamily N-acetyltransferase